MSEPQERKANVDPEIPANIARRRAVALTPVAAEDGNAKMRAGLTSLGASGIGADQLPDEDDGQPVRRTSPASQKLAKAAKLEAQRLMGVNPLFGMKGPDVEVIRGKSYRDQPAQDITGDRDQVFVNWLWKHHPADAVIRYAYRDIWPTEMPGKVKAEPVVTAGRAPRVIKGEAEVDRLKARIAELEGKAKKPAKPTAVIAKKPAKAKAPAVKPVLETVPVSKPGKIRVVVKAKA